MDKKIEEIDFNIDEKDLNKMINKERNQIFEYLSSKSLIDIIEEFDNFNEEEYSLTDEEFKKEILETPKISLKYEIDFETNEILRKGQNEKRKGNYKKAMAIYNFILLNAGPSGALFEAMAKTRASQGYYEEAIDLFLLANGSLGCCGKDSYHVSMLMNRKKMGKEKFKEYLESISGNPNFIMPKENKSTILERTMVRVGGFY